MGEEVYNHFGGRFCLSVGRRCSYSEKTKIVKFINRKVRSFIGLLIKMDAAHVETIDKLSTNGSYRNSREINLGGLPFPVRQVVVTAPVLAGLNVYLPGGTGQGKTQLANDLAGFFGDNYCYAEGRPDFELAELLMQVNLSRLHDVGSDKDLVELTENVQKALYYVDELNRCPPIAQNYFFNFFDGKLVHKGKVHRLGNKGYAIGFGSGNIGNGAYVGIEDSDRALKDRMHVIVKLDDPDYRPTAFDKFEIYGGKRDPRASLPDGSKDMLEDILAVHEAFKSRPLPRILQALGVYFSEGLDYLQGTRRHSKIAVADHWPNVEGVRQETDESKIMPLSPRAVFSTVGLSQALAMIAESRGLEVKDSVHLFLDALRLTVPYSGVLAPNYVHNEFGGDTYAAFDAVITGIREDIGRKKEALETALAFAEFGEAREDVLDDLCPVSEESRWTSVRHAIEQVAAQGPQDPQPLSAIVEEYKKPEAA